MAGLGQFFADALFNVMGGWVIGGGVLILLAVNYFLLVNRISLSAVLPINAGLALGLALALGGIFWGIFFLSLMGLGVVIAYGIIYAAQQ